MPQLGEQPKTVLFIIARLARGGAETVLLELVRRMARSNWRPVVVSLGPPDVLSEQFVGAGARVHHLGLERVTGAPLALVRLRLLAKSIAPQVVHGVMFYGDFCARFLRASGLSAATVGALHSTVIGPPAFERLLTWTDGFVDCVTAVSEGVAQQHIRLGTVRSTKLRVIPNGVDEQRLTAVDQAAVRTLQQRLMIQPGERVLLSVGRFEKEKNYSLLLRAFAALRASDSHLRLVLVGDGSLRARLASEAAELGLGDAVSFPGMLDPVAPAYQLADLFVLSSDIEGLPLVVLEAMAAGVPMVLTRVGGIPDVVRNKESAWLVPPGDAEALAAAVKQLLAAPEEERVRLVAAALGVFRERYSIDRMVQATLSLYDELTNATEGEIELAN